MSWAIRLGQGAIQSALGDGLAATVRALLDPDWMAPLQATPPFLQGTAAGLRLGTLDPLRFTPSPAGVQACLAALAAPLLGPQPEKTWLILGTSGVLFLGEYVTDGHTWLGSAGDIADELARSLGLEPPPLTLSTACSSTAHALLIGGRALAQAQYPGVLVVGLEALSPVLIEGFRSLMLLDPRGSRPFDRGRDGMHLGEALGGLYLDFPGTRVGRGRWLLGGAQVCAATGPAAQAPDSDAMYSAMAQALMVAGVDPGAVIAIKAHGLGSFESDRAEARALHRLYPRIPPLTSLKGRFGHTLGASGVLETVAFLACLDAGFIPPAAGFSEMDPDLAVSPLAEPLPARPGFYLLNFFGFGASYVSLVVGWFP